MALPRLNEQCIEDLTLNAMDTIEKHLPGYFDEDKEKEIYNSLYQLFTRQKENLENILMQGVDY